MRSVKAHQQTQQTRPHDARIQAMEALLDELAQENATLRFHGALRNAALTNALTGAFHMVEQLKQATHHQEEVTKDTEANGDATHKERSWLRKPGQELSPRVLAMLSEIRAKHGEQAAALADMLVSELLVSQPPRKRRRIVCLCGSTRKMKAFQEANLRETLAGRIVLTVGCDTKCDDMLDLSPEVKKELNRLHEDKIVLADEVLVLNEGGYAGESTRSEIAYAAALGKTIRWLEPPSDELLQLAGQQGEPAHQAITSASVGDQVQIAPDAQMPPDYAEYLGEVATVTKLMPMAECSPSRSKTAHISSCTLVKSATSLMIWIGSTLGSTSAHAWKREHRS